MPNVTLFIPFGRDISLLKNNLEYYMEMGIERILLSVHIRPEWEEGFLESVNKSIAGYPAIIAEIHTEPTNHSFQRYNRIRSKYCNSNDWVIVADLDEFYEFSMPLVDLVAYCEANRYDYVKGEFLDRVGPQGDLPVLDGNLWDRYPVGLRVTTKIAKAYAGKVVLSRAGIELTGGHHNALSGTGCPENKCTAIVHHFKWDSTCPERVRYMYEMHRDAKLPWSVDAENMLNYFNKKGACFEIGDPELGAYWPMYKRCFPAAKTGLKSIHEDPLDIMPRKNDSLEYQELGNNEFLVSNNNTRLRLNLSSMMILSLCNGKKSIQELTQFLRDAHPSNWHTIEHDIQSSLRAFYALGLIEDSGRKDLSAYTPI